MEVLDLESMDEEEREIPEYLPVLPLRDTVVFPDTVSPLSIGQPRSIKLIDHIAEGDKMLALVAMKNPEVASAGPEDLHMYGTVAVLQKMIKVPDGTLRVLVQGMKRFRVVEVTKTKPFLVARVEIVEDQLVPSKELEALTRSLVSMYSRVIALVPYLPEELQMAVANIDDPATLGYFVASTLKLKTEEKQQLLEELNVEKRLRMLSLMVTRELEVLELGSKIQTEVKSEIDKSQREYFLRQQLKAIQEELGEGDELTAEITELKAKIEEQDLSEDVKKQALREVDRLAKIPSASAEYTVIRTYLDWILSIPWNKSSEDRLDIPEAHKILNKDHYDLDKVKERILEYLSVRKLKKDMHGPILCFVGPPGVGKTSLGQSIAKALGRKFVRMSVGGMRDEAEIRGHRRTYIGAMPGTIVRSLRDAEYDNPVFMIDEVDKMGADFRGDPSSALLEVLDPEQNKNFRDYYLDLPIDLSKIMFITTANVLDPIPPALKDRMEVINLPGYTEDEKLHIAQKYLIPKQLKAHGLDRKTVKFQKSGITTIIRDYTREAGVRNIERQLAAICRKIARKIAEEGMREFVVNPQSVAEYLGKPIFLAESKRRAKQPGVATGVAWTQHGGDIIYIEVASMPGKGNLILTGQLGDVMKESAQAALSYVRSFTDQLDIEADYFQKHDIHVHVPAGAVPKDGPSAGVTITTALTSLLTGVPVREGLAMTGEITLTGQVLPIGGVKEKALAAHRAKLLTLILPDRNEKDLDDIPPELRKDMNFVLADSIYQVLKEALGFEIKKKRSARK